MKARTQYPGLAKKIVRHIESFEEDGQLYLVVRFMDDTHLTLVIGPQVPEIKSAELLRLKGGDTIVLRAYK